MRQIVAMNMVLRLARQAIIGEKRLIIFLNPPFLLRTPKFMSNFVLASSL